MDTHFLQGTDLGSGIGFDIRFDCFQDTLRNYSMGIELGNSPAECLAKAEADKTYVVQRQIVPYVVNHIAHSVLCT